MFHHSYLITWITSTNIYLKDDVAVNELDTENGFDAKINTEKIVVNRAVWVDKNLVARYLCVCVKNLFSYSRITDNKQFVISTN